MSWKSPALLLAAVLLVCGPVTAAPVDHDPDRALIELHFKVMPLVNLCPGTTKPVVVEMKSTPSARPWVQMPDTACCAQGGEEASATIDRLLSQYGTYTIDEFALGGAWYRVAVGCTQSLLEQKKFGEAVSFANREMERARAYRSEVNLGGAAASMEAHIRRLLLDANLMGCD